MEQAEGFAVLEQTKAEVLKFEKFVYQSLSKCIDYLEELLWFSG